MKYFQLDIINRARDRFEIVATWFQCCCIHNSIHRPWFSVSIFRPSDTKNQFYPQILTKALKWFPTHCRQHPKMREIIILCNIWQLHVHENIKCWNARCPDILRYWEPKHIGAWTKGLIFLQIAFTIVSSLMQIIPYQFKSCCCC